MTEIKKWKFVLANGIKAADLAAAETDKVLRPNIPSVIIGIHVNWLQAP